MSQGFTFGDFTAEEWEKYFSNSLAQIGNIPPVEVKISLLDLFIIPTSGKLFLFLGLCYTSRRDNIYSRFSFRSFLALVSILFHRDFLFCSFSSTLITQMTRNEAIIF